MVIPMEAIEWFVIGGILVAALDQMIQHTPWRENNIIQLILTAAKAALRVNR
jgi:hypothetical protein